MRSMLAKLTSPPWKKTIEKAIQSGIETVTMSLFHSKEAACILKVYFRSNALFDNIHFKSAFTIVCFRFSLQGFLARKTLKTSAIDLTICSRSDFLCTIGSMVRYRNSLQTSVLFWIRLLIVLKWYGVLFGVYQLNSS